MDSLADRIELGVILVFSVMLLIRKSSCYAYPSRIFICLKGVLVVCGPKFHSIVILCVRIDELIVCRL